MFTIKSKPDGLTIIGSIVPTLYFDQLVGRKEAQFDWAKFAWIGSPVQGESQMYMRADTPYKTIEDVRNAERTAALWRPGNLGLGLLSAEAFRGADWHQV